jgi:hypothetical protein
MDNVAWVSIETLVRSLGSKSGGADPKLFGWKERGYLAQPKDPFTWRRIIDEIKDKDLSFIASTLDGEQEERVASLMKSKPIMLKIAGEITNALYHSYQNRHKISLVQIESMDPSGFAT